VRPRSASRGYVDIEDWTRPRLIILSQIEAESSQYSQGRPQRKYDLQLARLLRESLAYQGCVYLPCPCHNRRVKLGPVKNLRKIRLRSRLAGFHRKASRLQESAGAPISPPRPCLSARQGPALEGSAPHPDPAPGLPLRAGPAGRGAAPPPPRPQPRRSPPPSGRRCDRRA